MRFVLSATLAAAALFFPLASAGADPTPPPAAPAAPAWTPPPDPYIWLEDVNGDRSMTWVKAENAKTLGVLQNDSRFAGLYKDALAIAQAKDRLVVPNFLHSDIYNFWQDADHVHGIWRKTTAAGYAGADTPWTTVLDLDALSKAENANWYSKGVDCEEPDETRCMISLSDGGEDKVTIREFDVTAGKFVDGGFVLPRGKQREAWDGPDAILVSREWKPGELTASGYPFIVKRVKRGESLDAAQEIFRGSAADGGYGVAPASLIDGDGNRLTLISRPLSTFEREWFVVLPGGVKQLAIPLKGSPVGLVAGRLVVSLDQDWSPTPGVSFSQGSLVSLDLAALKADPAHLAPTLIYAPNAHQALDGVSPTKDHLLVTILNDVNGRALVFTPTPGGGWTAAPLATPDNATLGIIDTDQHTNRAFLSAAGFLSPTTLSLIDTGTGQTLAQKAQPPKFDASKDQVEQFWATSTDGTKIPYFVVHPDGMKLDGSNPTLLTAYGGFQVSNTPGYSPILGKLWLERGGVFVLANIRGGGEFGPAWHEAGLKTKRQIIYDDFAAVSKDLIARNITTPRRLGIQGGSNGGLLMGVEFTQHPDLWNAVDIQVPLLDMIRFEQIAAGASWVGEYGSVSVPEERAFLMKISPYQNLKADAHYPEPLIWSTTKDDRVGPQAARKFAARLAEMGHPYMYYEVIEGGHGSGANLEERARTNALEYDYFIRKLFD